jgi:GntR family transcriptional regulator
MEISLTSKIPIFEQVKGQIKRYIELGIIAKDEKLPSVRELANQLQVNPNTIMRAYADLEKEAYIYSLNKKGYYASDNFKKNMKKTMSDLVKNAVMQAKQGGLNDKEIITLVKNSLKGDKND